MPKFVEYIVSAVEIEVGEKFDFISAGTIYRDAELVAAAYDDNQQDYVLTIKSLANGIEAIPYNDTVPLLPVTISSALDVPSATPKLAAQKISYLTGWSHYGLFLR
ncbi:hypothetical protein [Pseudomonas reactans]|jgi:hypothetical protein